MYEKCVRSGADGMSLLLRGGGPPTALGAGSPARHSRSSRASAASHTPAARRRANPPRKDWRQFLRPLEFLSLTLPGQGGRGPLAAR